MNNKEFMFGVHNKEFNLDYYDNGSIEIYNHIKKETITEFPPEITAVFIAILKQESELQKLLDINQERLELNKKTK